MMKRLAQVALMGVLVVASVAAAQQVPQPMVRTGNFIEVGNDVFMHIIASADIRYKTVHNYDCTKPLAELAVKPPPTMSVPQA